MSPPYDSLKYPIVHRFGLEFGYSNPPCGSDDPSPPDWWKNLIGQIHYLHFGFMLFLLTGIVS